MEQIPWIIPDNWKWVQLSEIAEINPQLPFDKIPNNLEVSFIPMARVEEETGEVDLSETKQYEAVKNSYTKFTDGDILFAKITPCMENGKIAIVNNLKNSIGFGSTEFHVVRLDNKHLITKFYFYFLLQKWFRITAKQSFTGTVGHQRVPTSFMREIYVPLPPYNEQIRIVNRIEELLTRTEAGQNILKKTYRRLKNYKRSLLHDAFIGNLTKTWRNKNKNKNIQVKEFLKKVKEERKKLKFKRRRNLKTKLNIDFPKPWETIKLDDIAMVADIDHKMPKDYPDGIPFLSPKDFEEPDKINLKNVKTISENDYKKLSKKVRPNENDILFSRIGTVGKVRKAPKSIKFQASYSLCIIRTTKIVKDYLYWILQSPDLLTQAIKGQRSVGVPDLGLRDIRNFIIPFPSKKEQQKIVNILDSIFSKVNHNLVVLEKGIKQSKNLKNSILKKAFEGRLVPQNPEDKPASALLKRIKDEKQDKKQTRLV